MSDPALFRCLRLLPAAILACSGWASPPLSAADFVWDVTPGTIGVGDNTVTGGSGTWDLTNGNWTITGGTNNIAWINDTNAAALFRGASNTTATVTLASAITANVLNFTSGTYIVTGGNLTLDGASPRVVVNTGLTNTISSILVGSNWSKRGRGTLVLAASNAFTGSMTVPDGVVEVNHKDALGSTDGGVNLIAGVGGQHGALHLSGNVMIAGESLALDSDILYSRGLHRLSGTNAWTGPITGGLIESLGGLLTVNIFNGSNAACYFGGNGDVVVTGSIATGTGSLTKKDFGRGGSGTLTLQGTNTYTGNTVVDSGTLILAENAQLTFRLTSTTNTSLTGSGAVVLNGRFAIDTTITDTSKVTSIQRFLVNVTNFSGPYGSNFSVVGWTDAGKDIWTKTVGDDVYIFTETNGMVTTSINGYGNWITGPLGYFPGVNDPGLRWVDRDPDYDGVPNLIEYVLNSNPAVPNPSVLPQPVKTPTGFEFTYPRLDISLNDTDQYVEFSTDLATWTPVQIPEPADTYSVGIATVTVTDGSPVDTVKVSFPSSAAPDGKLFARIRAEAGRSH